jgi:hypothetical protein
MADVSLEWNGDFQVSSTGLCPPSSHFTASDFTGSDNTEVFQNVLALAAFECSKIVTGWIGRDASERHARVAAHWAQRPVEAC